MAETGYGTIIDSNTMQTIGNIVSIDFGMSSGTIDYQQTTTKFGKSIPSGITPGTIGVRFNYDGSTGQEAEDFVRELKAKQTSTWTITYSSGAVAGEGFVQSISISAATESVTTMDATIKLSGETTFNGS